MTGESRRGFFARGGQVLAGAALAAAGSAAFAQEHKHEAGVSEAGATVAVTEKRCATCEFWGGMRHPSDDGKAVLALSQGWCNNPKSPNYKKLTVPDHGPMDTWQKWGALG